MNDLGFSVSFAPKGKRLLSPDKRAARQNAPWQRTQVSVCGNTVGAKVLVADAVWNRAAGMEVVRLVWVRSFQGRERGDAFVLPAPSLSTQRIIEAYAERWEPEVTFHECHGRPNFGDPQNRLEHAVEPAAPIPLRGYTLVVPWYVKWGQHPRAARAPQMPC